MEGIEQNAVSQLAKLIVIALSRGGIYQLFALLVDLIRGQERFSFLPMI